MARRTSPDSKKRDLPPKVIEAQGQNPPWDDQFSLRMIYLTIYHELYRTQGKNFGSSLTEHPVPGQCPIVSDGDLPIPLPAAGWAHADRSSPGGCLDVARRSGSE